jgi:NAD+ synthase
MIKNIPGLIEHVTINLQKRMDIAVVGLSGGADSTLVALLCKKALGADNVYGVHLPYNKLDLDTFNTKSRKLAEKIGIKDKLIQIGTAVEELSEEFEGLYLSDINKGNLRSRMRMVTLYTFARQISDSLKGEKRVRVLGTGNLSEDFIGYDTKGGDALADYFIIGDLLKSEVYQLLEFFRDSGEITEELINRVPSAGLWDGQTDELELGYSYAEMEPFVLDGLDGKWSLDNPIGKLVHDMHFANAHKHQAPPVVGLRGFCTE